MTDEMSRDARALLDAARGGDEPGAADRDRVRARVMAAVGAGAAATAGGSAGSSAGGVTAGKIALALVLAGAIAGVAYLALRSPGGGANAPERRDVPAVTRTEPAPPPEKLPEAAPAPAVTAPEPEPEPEIDMPVEAPAPVRRPVAHDPPADTLAAERALLRQASAALRDGDPDAALAALAEHARRFPKGVLVEERSAARVVALCAAGRTGEGMKARDAFLARWPRSVHAPRVQAACE